MSHANNPLPPVWKVWQMHTQEFCYVQVCTLDYDYCTQSARYVGSVKDRERSGGFIEKGENLISCDLGTQ